jgi:hypothetical protein
MASGGAGSWWVGENLTNQNSLRTTNFFSNNAPSGYQQVQAGNATDAAAFAASLASGKPTPPLHSISWQIVAGPYATQAEAKADIPNAQAAKPAPGEEQQAVSGIANSLGLPQLSNLRDLVVRTIKVLAGLALVIVGVSKLTGADKTVMKAATTAGKAAVLA